MHSLNYQLENTAPPFDKEAISKRKNMQLSVKIENKKRTSIWEIDLHIEEIVEAHSMLSNSEILKKQMDAFKRFYSNAFFYCISSTNISI